MTAPDPEAAGPQRSALRVGVAVPAAGTGRRMGGVRKPWLELLGEPILLHALRPFLARSDVAAVRVALGGDDADAPPEWIEELDPRIAVVPGGATRALSVARAVAALPDDLDVILVHDAARPLVDADVIETVVRGASAGEGAVAGLPATDTVKVVDAEGRVVETPDRSRIWLAQTPQGFPAELFRSALRRLESDEALRAGATDDASVVEAVGGEVRMVRGNAGNLKVTRPHDLPMAEFLMRRRGHRDLGDAAGGSDGGGDAEPFRILYVCTGNTCRSPMAEVLTRHALREREWVQVEVRSAGVAAMPGSPASEGAARAVARAGLSLDDHRSTPLSPELVEWADVVLTMSASHLDGVIRIGGEAKATLLTLFADGADGDAMYAQGVPDPFGGDDATYQATFDALSDLVFRTLQRLAPVVSP